MSFCVRPWLAAVLPLLAIGGWARSAGDPAEERALLASLEIKPAQLKRLALETTLVAQGRPRALICHADEPGWREAALIVQQAVAEATGVTLPMKSEGELTAEQCAAQDVVLLGHLDNHRHVARLYHNFFVCLDTSFTGRGGYEIRTVHDPFGTGHNCILIGGSFAEGTRAAAREFAAEVKRKGTPGSLTLGRLVQLKFDAQECARPPPTPMTVKAREAAVAAARTTMFSPGQGRAGVARLIDQGVAFHRYGNAQAGQAYRALMLALLELYRTDEYINGEGMRRYDRDFRDAWTHPVAILWDLHEESGIFSDQERLDLTNLVLRLALECVRYQGWDRPAAIAAWSQNRDIVHNHNTFPALGVLFAGNYLQRHYRVGLVDDWLKVAHGIFNGQKHSSKPLEDAAAYQWLPIIHTMIYSLAQGDGTFFDEGHARRAANVALMAMDCAGYQAAFGDHEGLKSSSGLGATLQMAGWRHRDPELLWGARLAGRDGLLPLGQGYDASVEPRVPASHAGVMVSRLPRQSYDSVSHKVSYPTVPNLPWEVTFDKLALRGGWERDDEYLLLDGFGRGNHMHFDANAIINFDKGGEPLLVDGEYIKNAPKYHNSVVIVRDGQGELAPAVAGLGRADQLATAAFTRTWLTQYNGADWTRCILWRRNDYVLVSDEVRALAPADFTLRCCWRPWGEATLAGGTLTVDHPPMRLALHNADGAAARLETMKRVGGMPVSRLSQQVSRTLRTGEAYRFLNVFHAESADRARQLAVRRLGEGLLAIERPEGRDLVALGRSVEALPGVRTDAEMTLLSGDRVVVAGATRLAGEHEILRASAPVSLELAPPAGTGVLIASGDVEVTLRLAPRSRVAAGEFAATTDADGVVNLKVPAGRHALKFEAMAMLPALRAAAEKASGQVPTVAGRTTGGSSPAGLALAWQFAGFDVPTEKLPVVASKTSAPPYGKYGPIGKLFDGAAGSSVTSVMWKAGTATTVTAELADEAEVRSVALREWHMNPRWNIGERRLEVSSDGFKQDVRTVDGAFAAIGEQGSGTNIATLMELKVGQKARQIRVTLRPARSDASVYLAEIEVHGARSRGAARLTAGAVGDLGGEGRSAILVATDRGQIVALQPDGTPRWSFTRNDAQPIHALACADLDGDGKAEVMYGGANGRLGLLSAEGRERWQVKPPKYRGTASDVMTVFPADLDGDGRPEIVCGCRSWQYFAYDVAGKMRWGNVIYAHSATVGCAADVDGDGKDEIVAGNAYYQVNLIDHDGKRLRVFGPLGPEMTAVAALPASAGQSSRIVAGVDDGTLHCYDAAGGKAVWKTSLGDKITRICRADLDNDGTDELVCAAESAHVFALKSDGRILWRCGLPDGAGDLVLVRRAGGVRLVVAAGDAGVRVLDARGKVVAAAATEGRAEALVVAGDRVVVTTSKGGVAAFELP